MGNEGFSTNNPIIKTFMPYSMEYGNILADINCLSATMPKNLETYLTSNKLLASLNHPSIAAIYGLEQAEGKRFLVLWSTAPIIDAGIRLVMQNGWLPAPHEYSLSLSDPVGPGIRSLYQSGKYRYPMAISIRIGPTTKLIFIALNRLSTWRRYFL